MNSYEKAMAFLQQFQQEGEDVSAVLAAYQSLTNTGKTPLGLNQWVLTDKPRMEEFNEDNRIVDERLRALETELANKAGVGLPPEYPIELKAGLVERYGKCTYSKDVSGRVHIQLNTATAVANGFICGKTEIGTLPVGFRPSFRNHAAAFVRATSGGHTQATGTAVIYIDSNGILYLDVFGATAGFCHAYFSFLAAQSL